MEVKIIEVTLMPKGKDPEQKRRLEKKVRKLAYDCSEEAWTGLLENPGPEAAKALQRAMQALAGYGDYSKAMDVLKALYAISEQEMPADVAAWQQHPVLLKLFLDEFLTESEDYLDEFSDMDADLFEIDDLSN